jgi:hypothetical protein
LASGYTTRAQWLAALKTADLAAKRSRPLYREAPLRRPHRIDSARVTSQNTLSRPDFLKMVQQQAWIAKNDPGFYSWQHKVEQQVQKKIDAENSSGVLQILGLIFAAVVVIVLSAVSYAAFSGFAAGVINGQIPANPKVLTFSSIRLMTLQWLPVSSRFRTTRRFEFEFDTLQLNGDLQVPRGQWNTAD